MATGTATLNFGAAPGGAYASVDVTGQSGLSSASDIESFEMSESTADHGADDVRADPLFLVCEFLTATSFRIHAHVVIGLTHGDRKVRWVTNA